MLRRHPVSRLSVSLLALMIALPATAQDGGETDVLLDEIVVTANRTPSELSRTGVSVTAVAEEDIRAAANMTELLQRLPGISAAPQGPFGNPANLRIRGADGRYIAVYIDGIRVDDPSSTEVKFDFGSLMTSDISRIEVLRGSQSALWGGSAVGGVINITSAKPQEDGFHQTAEVEAGSFGSAKLGYGLTFKDDRLELAMTASHFRTDGFSAASSGTEADGAETSRLSFSARYQITDALAVGMSAFRQETDQDYDGYIDTDADGFGDTLADLNNTLARTETGARVFAELSAGQTDHQFNLSTFDSKRNPTDENGSSTFKGKRLAFGYQGTTTINSALSLIYGADWTKETADYDNLPAGTADTEIAGAFLQALYAPSDVLDLSAVIRTDRNSSFGSFTTGRLAAAWRPFSDTTIRAAIATGFRAPSLDERFGDYPTQFFVGNPNLQPEESTSYEVGVEQEFAGGAVLSVTAFRLEVSNLIQTTSAFDTLENVSGVSVRQGIELAATLPVGADSELGLSYTYTDAVRPSRANPSIDTPLTRVPRDMLGVTLDTKLSDRLTAGAELRYIGGLLDNDPNTFAVEAMPDVTILNARFAYQLSDQTEAYLRIENLTDRTYELANGYNSSERAVYVGVSAKF